MNSLPRHIHYFGFLALHIVVLVAWLASPFFLAWPYVALIGILYYLQFPIVGGCILTKLQFKGERNEFLAHYSQKLGLPMGSRFFHVVGNTMPIALFLIAVLRG